MCITKKYSANKKFCKVTFVLPEHYADEATKAYVVGDFNDWKTNDLRMKRVHGKFTRTITLETNQKYQFRYLIDDDNWKNEWEADALAPVNSGKWYNSVVVV